MTTLLDRDDLLIVTKTLVGVQPADVPRLRQIHVDAIAAARKRRSHLAHLVTGIDRAIAMRTEALRQLDALETP